jgi:hypothetical protein
VIALLLLVVARLTTSLVALATGVAFLVVAVIG